ncbi:MAG: hypothetical protein WCE54_10205 [Ignavibacteriaceae bacterium]
MDKDKLKRLSSEYELNPAVPQKIPKSTYWPFILAFSVTLVFWGFATTIFISLVGLIILGFAIFGWIMELKP